MTLGCGGFGGNITSDNITPRHLLNIKRLAYELRPATSQVAAGPAAMAPRRTEGAGIDSATLGARIDQYLKTRGFAPARPAAPPPSTPQLASPRPAAPPTPPVEKPAAFVCEDDVRQAIRVGQTLTISDKTIVTPSARDLGEAQRVFRQVGTTGPIR